jgi:hypothetical protein
MTAKEQVASFALGWLHVIPANQYQKFYDELLALVDNISDHARMMEQLKEDYKSYPKQEQ